MKSFKTKTLVEGALMIALATVLSYIRVYQLPWGGSITLLSMLPICVFSIKNGVKKGLVVSFAYSLIQFGQGIIDGLFGWGLTPVMLVACIFLDYILAYTCIGFAGIFAGKSGNVKKSNASTAVRWILGCAFALVLRFICHLISGIVIWESAGKLWEGFSTSNTFLYSFLYNGSYMLPEIIFTSIGAFVLFSVPQMRKLMTQE
jgi:thiamine transporter